MTLTIFDSERQIRVPCEQDWIDNVQEIFRKLGQIHQEIFITKSPQDLSSVRLKVFPNPMRHDGVFVAEDQIIKPYPDVKGPKGELIYPAVPLGVFSIPAQLPLDFAQELVKRWNGAIAPDNSAATAAGQYELKPIGE